MTENNMNEMATLPTTSDPLLDRAQELVKDATMDDLEKISNMISEINFEAVKYMRIASHLKYNYDLDRGKKWLKIKDTPREKDGKNHSDKECDVISKHHVMEKYGSHSIRDQIGWGYIRIADQLRDKKIELQAIDKQQRQNTEFN